MIVPTALGHNGGPPVKVRPASMEHVDDAEWMLDEHTQNRSLGTSAIESTMCVGETDEVSSVSLRYLPVRTRTPRSPASIAPPTSASMSSPTRPARAAGARQQSYQKA